MVEDRVGAGEVWRREGTLVVARRWVIERVDPVQQGTVGTHKGPHSTPNHPCPYAEHDVIHK